MTKVIIPQIGDFVQDQTLTEHGHKSLNDLSDKVDALENVANDETSEALATLQDEVAALNETITTRPKFEVITSGEQIIYPLEDGYDYYEVSALVSVLADPSDVNILRLVGLSDRSMVGADAVTPLVRSIYASVHREELSAANNGSLEIKYFADGTETPATINRWVIKKYKSEY